MKKIVFFYVLCLFSETGLNTSFEEYAISEGLQKTKSFFAPAFRSLISHTSEKIRERVARLRTKIITDATNLAFGELEKEIKKADPVVATLQNVVRKRGFTASILGMGLSGSMFFYELYLQHKRKQHLSKTIADTESIIKEIDEQIKKQNGRIEMLKNSGDAEPKLEALSIAQLSLKEMQTKKRELETMLQTKKKELSNIPARLIRKLTSSLLGITGFAAIGITTVGAGAAAQWLEWLKTLRIKR